MRIESKDYGKYYPVLKDGRWGFQEAFIDAFCYPHILPSSLWQHLFLYTEKNGGSLFKFYNSRVIAIIDLHISAKRLGINLNE